MTTETNAEKLEAIMQISVGLTDNEGCFADIVQLDVDDYAWIVQQAEQAQKLEKENMRYKRALKHITVFPTYFSHEQHSKRALKIARKVLRGKRHA